jgi:hydroxypyruvate isomerase
LQLGTQTSRADKGGDLETREGLNMNIEHRSPLASRRQLLRAAAAASVLGQLTPGSVGRVARAADDRPTIRQSIVHWCFGSRGEQWSVERTCQVAKELGYTSVELVSPEHFPTLQRFGLTCAIVGARIDPGPAFMRGFNNPQFQPMVIRATQDAIDAAAAHGYPNVIAFTGFSAHDPLQPDGPHFTSAEGAANCVRGFKEVIGYAEQKGVNICLEMLNTRDDSDPMKGHPGYQGNHIDYCADIVKAVGSPRMKLLFDIYHVQIMDGDVIRRLEQHREYLGHIHTAGNPGRGELNANQEINYPAVIRTLKRIGYDGFVGQEFIPTGDPYQGLKEAFEACNV